VSIQGFYAGSTTGPLLAVPLLGPHISVYVYCGFVLCARLQRYKQQVLTNRQRWAGL